MQEPNPKGPIKRGKKFSKLGGFAMTCHRLRTVMYMIQVQNSIPYLKSYVNSVDPDQLASDKYRMYVYMLVMMNNKTQHFYLMCHSPHKFVSIKSINKFMTVTHWISQTVFVATSVKKCSSLL